MSVPGKTPPANFTEPKPGPFSTITKKGQFFQKIYGHIHVLALITEVQQGGHIVVDMENNAASMAAVTAVRAAGGHIFLPVEGHRAVSAAPGLHGDGYLIDKTSGHKNTLFQKKQART